jgi:hypothetical protein
MAATVSAPAAAAVDFATQIQPIFAARCIGCHGADKAQARLRLDSAEQIGAFRKDTLLAPGKPEESELFKRISLPAENRRRMPKEGDPLAAEQVELIRQWIAEGAVLGAAPADGAEDVNETGDEKPEPLPLGEEDPELTSLPPASVEAIQQIEATGASVMPLFAGSPLLQVSFAQASSPPTDESLKPLASAAEQIVWLNLSGAQISAAGMEALKPLENLIQLHLEKSNVDDAGLAQLAGMSRLEYLNIYGTTATDAGLEPLKGLKRLRKLYVWQTKASYDAAQALQAEIPGLEVNLGWDHPEVARRRLTKELETAKQIAEAATARVAEVKQQVEAAEQAQDQAEKRVEELEAELEALSSPDDKGADADGESREGESST